MKTITVGRSGLDVSRIASGTWQLGGDWGRFDEVATVTTIRRARELAVNFFDTAQAYGFGAAEQLLGLYQGALARREGSGRRDGGRPGGVGRRKKD